MNATETIQAAIVKLERRDSRWTYSADNFEIRAGGVTVAENVMPPDGDLIIALRDAVPGQLDILHRGLEATTCNTNRTQNAVWIAAAHVLARSILGVSL